MRLMRNLENRELMICWKRHSRKHAKRGLQKEDENIWKKK